MLREALDDPEELARAIEDLAEIVLLPRGDRVEPCVVQELCEPADRVERPPEVMGEPGQDILLGMTRLTKLPLEGGDATLEAYHVGARMLAHLPPHDGTPSQVDTTRLRPAAFAS